MRSLKFWKREGTEKTKNNENSDLPLEVERFIEKIFHVVNMSVVEILESPDGGIHNTIVLDVCTVENNASTIDYVRKFESENPGIKVRPAKISEYVSWVNGYLKQGGKITHDYDYPIERVLKDIFVAESDFYIQPLRGSESVGIIVPKGIKFLGDKNNLGHINLYLEDEFITLSSVFAFVPRYLNIRDLIKSEWVLSIIDILFFIFNTIQSLNPFIQSL